jgi:hypothetical protein
MQWSDGKRTFVVRFASFPRSCNPPKSLACGKLRGLADSLRLFDRQLEYLLARVSANRVVKSR